MYKCCKTVLQSNWKYCPHCADANPHFADIKKQKYYPYEGRNMFDNSRKVAVKTDEFRPPRKGEYYLSGAGPIAYLAYHDLSDSFRIMRLIDKPVELPR